MDCNEGAKVQSNYLLRIQQMSSRPIAAIVASASIAAAELRTGR